ncbi:MAG: outer membrane protein assembly factor BamA [Betaproteobacteria bacterium]|jgi:outer membrane protein insertion porin family|nr:outer membrane protein assembly factor BamA [Betaproteobacteria bacterium]
MRSRLAAALLGLLLILSARGALAFEPFTVRDIRLEGIQRIEAGTVFGYLPVKVGDQMTEAKAAEAIRALFATGLFRDVRVEVEGDVVVVIVTERPAIAQIDFVGMKEFEPDQVRKALRETGISEGRTFDRASVDKAEQEIKRQYLTRGKYAATVATTVTPLERNRVALNFTIDEGDAAKIRSINIVGNRAYGERELLKQFSLTTPTLLSWWTKSDQYSREKLRGDLESLRSFYLDRGFLDFNIESTQVSITPDRRDIYITVNIHEGDRYTVTDVTLGGQLLLPEAELKKLITIKPGETFSRAKLTETTKAITDRLGNEGYAFANANAVPNVDKAKRTVAFAILIDPGRRVYVRRINVIGNTKTRDVVIRRELRQLEGAFYDNEKLQESKKRLDRLGYFDEVEINTEPVAGTTDQVDVTYRVKEKPTGNLLLGIGFSSGDGIILQGSITQANLFGTGQHLSLGLNTSKVNRNLGLSWTEPYWTINGVSLGFDIYNRRFDAGQLDLGNYITETYGAGVRVGFPITDIDRINFGLTPERTSIELFADSPQRYKDFVAQNGSDPWALIGTVSWGRDTRDNATWPTSGQTQRLFLEVALPGADLKYWKASYQHQWYVPVTRDITLRLNGELGYADGYGDGTVPFYKNFYTGGVYSVRGFQTSTLGPRDINGPLGGTRKVVGNIELLFPIPGLGLERSVRVGPFFDVGQVWANLPGQELSDVKLRYSVGGLFNWNSPFGPITLTFGVPLNEEPLDQIQKFQFALGGSF